MPNASRPAVQRVSYVYIISTVPSSLLTHACCPFSSPCLPITQQQCIVEMHMALVCIRFDIPSHRFAIEIRQSHHLSLIFLILHRCQFWFCSQISSVYSSFSMDNRKKKSNSNSLYFLVLMAREGNIVTQTSRVTTHVSSDASGLLGQ